MNLVLPKGFAFYSFGLMDRELEGKIVPCYGGRVVTDLECETCTLPDHEATIEIPESEAINHPRGWRAAIAEKAARVSVQILRHIKGEPD